MPMPPRPRGWDPQGTATWQRAELARQRLLGWIAGQAGTCPRCMGRGAVLEPTAPAPGVRRWLVPVVCSECRKDDAAK